VALTGLQRPARRCRKRQTVVCDAQLLRLPRPNANDGRALAIAGLDMGFSRFEGILRKPYSPSMPAFPEARLSRQDAADIYAWLRSLK